MTRKHFNIVWLFVVCLITGCATEPVPFQEAPAIRLTVKCDESRQTKADDTKEGEQTFNENLIKSVDFFFYPGESPASDADAVYHIRKELSRDSMQPHVWEETFDLVIKKEDIGKIFKADNDNKATVYALVNFDRSFIDGLSGTSREAIGTQRIVKDFAQNEADFIQPGFLMDGAAVVLYEEDAAPYNVDARIEVTRFASKLTVAVRVADSVVLKHQDRDNNPDETWQPVKHTMRLYLVDGVKSVLLSHDGGTTLPDSDAIDPDPDYFSYKEESTRRPFFREDNTSYFVKETVDGKDYYGTWPMYSYPAEWDASEPPSYSSIDYTEHDSNLPPEPPYFKLEMDWRRVPDKNYDYDRRKYYYKIYLPFNSMARNKWYGFYVDVSLLGAETDEGKAVLDPTCYLMDWQNKELAINKYAVISKARYLSVDKTLWSINNMNTLTIPFLSSHNVTVVPGSVKATRPYYGVITDAQPVGSYHKKLHGTIRQQDENNYYLEFQGQPAGNEKWEPANWISNTSTSIVLNHPLVNDNTKDDFDYSVYTIEFDIVHTDLVDNPESHTYSQYLRHITIVQHPGIYIERLHNSDTLIRRRNPKETSAQGLYGYEDGEEPWADKPWGYVYVNGGRFIRSETKSHTGTEDRYFDLHTNNNKREYQWQTVWYTGGSRDIWDIHATVLPSTSTFVIGDPRESRVNNLEDPVRYDGLYIFNLDGPNAQARYEDHLVLETIRSNSVEYPNGQRVGFNSADALYGGSPRKLTWYYPTENSSRTENMVAPSYRISSKFSGIEFGNLDKKYAEYRCAAFQEDGFPAGRWRLPTKAEINFIGMLSAKGFIEFLFNNNGVYWSANGAVKVSGTSVDYNSASTALLRCVYDSWYWDEIDGLKDDPRQPQRDKFVWGDKER